MELFMGPKEFIRHLIKTLDEVTQLTPEQKEHSDAIARKICKVLHIKADEIESS